MSKQALALASLVMAIPAGFACYVCVMAILGHNESMPILMTVIMWTLSILCLIMALFPLLILGFMKSAPQTAAAAAPSAPAASPAKPGRAQADDDDEFESAEGEEPLFDADDAADGDFDDNFDFDDDAEEEEAPKKKKKKK